LYVIEVAFGTPSFDEMIYLRDLILRKPLNLAFTPQQLSAEYNSVHFGAYNLNDELLGTLVMKPLSKKQVKMRQVAVFPEHQKKGIGQLLVVASEGYAKEEGFKEIVLNARVPAVPFYEKLGYAVDGDMFEEVGIDHYTMKKKL